MGSPLGPLLTDIFMALLEEEVIPKLMPYQCLILTKLNSYHPNIQFTFELEKNKQITFLDVLVKRTVANQIETCVHRKETSTDLYINWNLH